MKVEFSETVSVTGSVAIGIEEIETALRMAFYDAVEAHEMDSQVDITHRQQIHVINLFINAVHQCLSGVPNEMIERASDEIRRAFSESLLKQSQRWAKT